MGSHFADQCSNLDLRFGNGRHRMDEYQRYPQPTEPLVCQPAFSGDHRACDLSYDGSNLRKGCNRIHSAHKYRSAILGRVMVRMETKEFILSFRHSFCHTDDFTIPVYLSQ